MHAFEHLLQLGLGHGHGGFEAVFDRQHAFGKGLDGVFAGLGDFFVGAAAGVFGLGLGAQKGVRRFTELGLQLDHTLLCAGWGGRWGGRCGAGFGGTVAALGAVVLL